MAWYHLSFKKNLTAIVKTGAPKGPSFLHPSVPKWINDLKPEDIYREPASPPRVSIAPSVWQCVAGSGRADGNPSGNAYIYEVQTDVTIKRSFDSIETVISDEHWITDSIINENIPIIQIGFMEIDDIFVELKKNYQKDDVLDKMKSINEKSIWIVKGEDVKERQWYLNLDELSKIRQ
jgi:hypothetical protein